MPNLNTLAAVDARSIAVRELRDSDIDLWYMVVIPVRGNVTTVGYESYEDFAGYLEQAVSGRGEGPFEVVRAFRGKFVYHTIPVQTLTVRVGGEVFESPPPAECLDVPGEEIEIVFVPSQARVDSVQRRLDALVDNQKVVDGS